MRFDIHSFKDKEAAIEWAINEIDGSAGKARARYITITAGQDATYQAKYADALAFVRAGYPEDQVDQYPWVQKEAEAIGSDAKTAADEIKSTGDPWNLVLGPKIEGLRIKGKRDAEKLDSISAIVQLVRVVQSELDAV